MRQDGSRKMQKFRRLFAPNPNTKYDPQEMRKIAEQVIYVCDAPMYGDNMSSEHRDRYEGNIARSLEFFDPVHDGIILYGDALIFALMLFYLSHTLEAKDTIRIARWNAKRMEYDLREIGINFFPEFAE